MMDFSGPRPDHEARLVDEIEARGDFAVDNDKTVAFAGLTPKQAAKLAAWQRWGAKMTLARMIHDEVAAKAESVSNFGVFAL